MKQKVESVKNILGVGQDMDEDNLDPHIQDIIEEVKKE